MGNTPSAGGAEAAPPTHEEDLRWLSAPLHFHDESEIDALIADGELSKESRGGKGMGSAGGVALSEQQQLIASLAELVRHEGAQQVCVGGREMVVRIFEV
jgi:hypothetical protein